MLISLNWLKNFVKISDKLDPKDLANELTLKTAEVEKVINEAENFENMVVGKIVELKPHPNADKLRIAMTDVGSETVQIVCGGANLEKDMLVAVGLPGAKVKWHGEGDLITLEKTKIRGEESTGMICAGSEIGIPDANEGEKNILDLTELKVAAGTSLATALNKDDVIFEFDNKALTHRPDLWGHMGIAREIAAITSSAFTELKPKVTIPAKGDSIKVEIENFELCPRYCGLVITDVEVGESPDWLKKSLLAVGHGTHNNVVDVTNYVMAELGQPLHAFDQKNIEGEIIVRTAQKGEKIATLDGKNRELHEDMLIIADHKKPLAVAGVMGGEDSGINERTTTIIIESANFNAVSVRKTSTKLGLRTDAVQRFEKSLDPHLAELAIQRAAELILKVSPTAKIAGPITDIQKFNKTPLTIDLDIAKCQSKIGTEISDKEIKKILEKLEFKVVENKNTFKVTVPTFRSTKDVTIEDDLIEEVARLFGYDNIPVSFPSLPTTLPQENNLRFKKHKARELFSYGLGFSEVYNYSFYSKNDLKNALLSETGHLKIINYLSEDQTHMRTALVPNLLKSLQSNSKNFGHLKLYEIGRTYLEIGEFHPLEQRKIAGAILRKETSDATFYEAKGAVEAFLKKFNIPHVNAAKGIKNAPYAHPTKSLSYIDQNAQTIAQVFVIHPVVKKNYDLEKYSIAFFEINFEEACKLANPVKKYAPLPKFPSINFDISVLVDKDVEIATIKNQITGADKDLIHSAELFDIYQGDRIDKDKKAVAFQITLQADDRTLTDQDMTKTYDQIVKNLSTIGGEIRGGN